MKALRFLRALPLALLALLSPAQAAEQSSYVTPIVGPMTMGAFANTRLNPALRAIASCHNGPSAPANGPSAAPLAYQCWVDTTANPSLYKLYDGASWVTLGSLNTSTHAWIPYLTGGTSGGVPYFSSAGVLGSSAALAQNGFVVGGGAGAAPATIPACTDDQIAFGRTSSTPLCRTVTGDITFASGVAAVGPTKITSAMLNADVFSTAHSWAGQQTFVAPILGTPASGNLANATNLPITGVSGLAANIANWLATSSSANLASALTDETGTGAAVFGTSPTLTTPLIATQYGGTAPGSSVTVQSTNNGSPSGDAANVYANTINIANPGSGASTINLGRAGGSGAQVNLAGTTSGSQLWQTQAAASGTATMFAGTDTAVGRATTDTLTNKTLNCTNNTCTVRIGSDVSGLGAGVASWLATASSANLAAALTDETGTGASVFGTAPTISSAVLTGTTDIQQAVSYSGDITPTQVIADQNDYAPTGFSTASVVRISTDAIRNFTGLAGGADGRTIYIYNVGSFSAVFKEENLASTAANRFQLGGDLTIASKQGATLIYDGTASRWRQVGGPSASGIGSGTVTSITCGSQTITTSGNCITDPGYGFQNASLAVSAAGSALTITLNDASGATPSPTSPATVFFRNATTTTGTVTPLNVTGANSLVISSGSTLGVTSSTAFRLWVVGFNDAGTFRLGVINARSGLNIFPLMGSNIGSSTAEGGAGAADNAQTFYTGTAVTSKPYRVLGYIEWNPTGLTAGTWTTTNLASVQMAGHDVPLPGQRVQLARTDTGTLATGTTVMSYSVAVTQTDGVQYMTLPITPTSAANPLIVKAGGFFGNNSGTGLATVMALFEDSITNSLATVNTQVGSTVATGLPHYLVINKIVVPNLNVATTFKIRAGSTSAGTTSFNGVNGTQACGGVCNSFMEIEEIMG